MAGETLKLEDIEKAFSVERLNKDFFKDYKTHYETFTAHLLAPANAKANRTAFGIEKHAEEADQDKADKPIRDFVKRLLGRLVFLHFLQKKGWMGCPAKSKAWTGGDPDFLASYFAHAESKKDAHRFHSHWLIPLFFDALNNAERPGDLFPPTGTRIPYLNGGLFETDPAPLHALDFPAELFRALLEFFGQYHFTIDENDPEDHEVGIDPEMLGHIFENLLEDNKDKGAYYTPKVIVSYMARQSLLHYLQTHLGENAELAVLLNEKDTAKHTDKDSFVRQNAKRIADLLDAVKICDPAIGSGAFPIGVLQEILWTRLTLNWELNTPEERAKLKRRIIQNSIHGVDLDPGAVEIARLRFWLALVVDEDQPRPLPNLDYKIMQGDGLLEWFEGIDLSRLGNAGGGESPFLVTFFDGDSELNLGAAGSGGRLVAADSPAKEMPKMISNYFQESRGIEKRKLHTKIDRVVLDQLRHCVDSQIEIVKVQIDQQKKLLQGKLIRTKGWMPAKSEKQIEALKAQLSELRATSEKLERLYHHHTRPFFLWHLFFQDVFAQGGFDIVIANPPNVRADNPDALIERKKVEATGTYDTLWEKWDLYVAFIEQGYKLLRTNGTLCFIVSDAYCHSKYAQKYQELFLKNARVLRLDFLSELKVFDAAVRNVLFFYQKANGHSHLPERRLHRGRFNEVIDLPTKPQSEANCRLFFPGDQPTTEFSVPTVLIEELCYISVGMVAHANEKLCLGAFILDDLVSDKKDKKHPKAFAEGKHLARWLPATHRWIEWDTDRAPAMFRRPTFPELYAVPEKLISVDISAGAENLRVSYDDKGLLHNHSAWSFVPWHYLKNVTNRSITKQAKYRRERPTATDRKREDLEKLSEAYDAKYLLAVMNSRVARDWIMGRRRSNLHLYPDDWKPLPVPICSATDQKRIVKLVDKLLNTLGKQRTADVSDLEATIDNEITQIYGNPPPTKPA
ncbi:MAG: Eco57I restriction-modification methylase domain-containing protein, partial [Verrucomicrobiaceae bacterium]